MFHDKLNNEYKINHNPSLRIHRIDADDLLVTKADFIRDLERVKKNGGISKYVLPFQGTHVSKFNFQTLKTFDTTFAAMFNYAIGYMLIDLYSQPPRAIKHVLNDVDKMQPIKLKKYLDDNANQFQQDKDTYNELQRKVIKLREKIRDQWTATKWFNMYEKQLTILKQQHKQILSRLYQYEETYKNMIKQINYYGSRVITYIKKPYIQRFLQNILGLTIKEIGLYQSIIEEILESPRYMVSLVTIDVLKFNCIIGVSNQNKCVEQLKNRHGQTVALYKEIFQKGFSNELFDGLLFDSIPSDTSIYAKAKTELDSKQQNAQIQHLIKENNKLMKQIVQNDKSGSQPKRVTFQLPSSQSRYVNDIKEYSFEESVSKVLDETKRSHYSNYEQWRNAIFRKINNKLSTLYSTLSTKQKQIHRKIQKTKFDDFMKYIKGTQKQWQPALVKLIVQLENELYKHHNPPSTNDSVIVNNVTSAPQTTTVVNDDNNDDDWSNNTPIIQEDQSTVNDVEGNSNASIENTTFSESTSDLDILNSSTKDEKNALLQGLLKAI